MAPSKINAELARILEQRIAKAIDSARYYPAKNTDAKAAAADVIRPFLETQTRSQQQ